jgi:ABC-type Mn2+/Zn2+ transport system permease subunit
LIALAVTWIGLFVSFYTPYPASFFITCLAFVLYVLVRVFHHKIAAPGEQKGWRERVLPLSRS